MPRFATQKLRSRPTGCNSTTLKAYRSVIEASSEQRSVLRVPVEAHNTALGREDEFGETRVLQRVARNQTCRHSEEEQSEDELTMESERESVEKTIANEAASGVESAAMSSNRQAMAQTIHDGRNTTNTTEQVEPAAVRVKPSVPAPCLRNS